MTKILTFDLGTTYFKIALFDRDGRLCDLVRVAPPIRREPADRMELDAHDFAAVLAGGVRQLAERSPAGLADVAAVSFATQTNSFLLLDSGDRPLTPLVLWPDDRAASLAAEVERRTSLDDLTATTGIPSLGTQFMVAKLLWFQEEQDDVWRQTARLCLISDYLTFLFTGKHATEAGAAGLTGLLDIHRVDWWEPMVSRFGLDRRQLPEPVRAGTDLGPILRSAAEQFGLPRDCRFVAGCLDQYAGAIGVGNVAPGTVSETTGTVLATVRCAAGFEKSPPPGVFQGPAFCEGFYWRMAFGNTSANYLEWYKNQLPTPLGYDELCAMAQNVPPGADGLCLRPDAPLTTPAEVFSGLTPQHTPGHAVRAILEGVSQALVAQVRSLCPDSWPTLVRCAGGAAKSPFWLQLKANALAVPVAATCCEEPTSLGAAILAESVLSSATIGDVAGRWTKLGIPLKPSQGDFPNNRA